MILKTHTAPLITGEIIFKRDISIFRGNCSFTSALTLGNHWQGRMGTHVSFIRVSFASDPIGLCSVCSPLSLLLLGTQWRLPWGRMGWGKGGLSSLNPWGFTSLCALKKRKRNPHLKYTQSLHTRHLRYAAVLSVTTFSIIKNKKGQYHPPHWRAKTNMNDRYVLDFFGLVPK